MEHQARANHILETKIPGVDLRETIAKQIIKNSDSWKVKKGVMTQAANCVQK